MTETEGNEKYEETNSMEIIVDTTEITVHNEPQKDSRTEKEEDNSIQFVEGTGTRKCNEITLEEESSGCIGVVNANGDEEKDGTDGHRTIYDDDRDFFDDSLEEEELGDKDKRMQGIQVSQPIGASELHRSITKVGIHQEMKEREELTEKVAAIMEKGKEVEIMDSEETNYEITASQIKSCNTETWHTRTDSSNNLKITLTKDQRKNMNLERLRTGLSSDDETEKSIKKHKAN